MRGLRRSLNLSAIRRRLFTLILRRRIVTHSHPLRVQVGLAVTAVLLIVSFGWRFFARFLPLLVAKFSRPIFQATQTHPAFSRLVHVLINAIPDSAFALLALAGLGYLAPGFIKELEEKRGVRIFLFLFFGSVGVSAIVINAVNRESQEFKDGQNNDRIGLVLKDVTDIQDALNPKTARMTESERRAHLLTTLRDEYVLRPGVVDTEILSGTKSPPAEWINSRLQQMGEPFSVKDVPAPSPPKIVQQIFPVPKKAHVIFSFYQPDLHADNPKTVIFDSIGNNTASVSISAIVTGDVPAEDLHIWIRRCKDCRWLANPPEFSMSDSDHEYDRAITLPKLEPNIMAGKWDFSVQLNAFPRFDALQFSCYYACDNCDTVDWRKPQQLWVTRTMQAGFKLLSPRVSYAPEPMQK